ncbi:neutrophil gelatinase-associated lipocalin [Mustela erminea]|uniref:neutrophil gelatinase-associated lipocalin n=1 Tax=Mustela erminea TaxID=36723 RepID=UPI0013873368|nr:neutrophil gelatinase-associated lipocalin [Mustela erminea]
MARGILCLGLVLLGALQAPAQDSLISPIPVPQLISIPLQRDFQEDKFQGKWYVVGIAGNSINATRRARFKMYTTTYELKDDHSYNVTSTMIRNDTCDHWIRTFVPNGQPGQFTLGDIESHVGVQNYTVRVMMTNYNQFAMMFFKKIHDNYEFFKISLYGRTKELSTDMKDYFTRFAKSLGLTDDHIIFPVPIDECIDDK